MKFNRELNLITQATPSEALKAAGEKVVVPPRPDLNLEKEPNWLQSLANALGLRRGVKPATVDMVLKQPRTARVKQAIFINGIENPDSYASTLDLARSFDPRE